MSVTLHPRRGGWGALFLLCRPLTTSLPQKIVCVRTCKHVFAFRSFSSQCRCSCVCVCVRCCFSTLVLLCFHVQCRLALSHMLQVCLSACRPGSLSPSVVSMFYNFSVVCPVDCCNQHIHIYIYAHTCIHKSICVCVCVCVDQLLIPLLLMHVCRAGILLPAAEQDDAPLSIPVPFLCSVLVVVFSSRPFFCFLYAHPSPSSHSAVSMRAPCLSDMPVCMYAYVSDQGQDLSRLGLAGEGITSSYVPRRHIRLALVVQDHHEFSRVCLVVSVWASYLFAAVLTSSPCAPFPHLPPPLSLFYIPHACMGPHAGQGLFRRLARSLSFFFIVLDIVSVCLCWRSCECLCVCVYVCVCM